MKTTKQGLKSISDYIIQTEMKLADMEKNLSTSDAKNRLYSRVIKDLKEKLTNKQLLIDKLNNEVKTLLGRIVLLQGDHSKEISERESQIKLSEEEINNLEQEIADTRKKAKEEKSEMYFKQAQQEENLAKKTRLAPKKKKQYFKNAYDLYKKSFEEGNNAKAHGKMLELEDKVF